MIWGQGIERCVMAENKPTEENDSLAVVMREHLTTELDRHVGKSQDRFRRFVQEQSQDNRSLRLPSNRFRGWVFSLTGAALAACLGFLMVGPRSAAPIQPAQRPTSSTRVDLPWIQQTADSQTYDGGTYIDANGNPVRVLHEMQWDRTRWFDQNQQLRAERVVPHDNVVYVKMKTY